MTNTVKNFNGTEELQGGSTTMRNEEFALRFPGVKGKRSDSFSKWVGQDSTGALCPITRTIFYKNQPSLHECDGRCRSAKGPNCECQCGGKFHGAN